MVLRAVFTLALVSVLSAAVTAAEAPFRAGYAQVDITPTKPMPMWGYGARHALFSTGTRDSLFAKAVVIEAGSSKLAIVGLDLGRSLGEPHHSRIQSAVQREAGVEHLLISGSHTHHGPVLELKNVPGQGQGRYDDAVAYVEDLEKKLTGVILEAAKDLQDARIGWETESVDLNRNRHSKIEPKPRDTELAVIRIDTAAGKPLAVIVNFAAHPTILSGSDLRWSAEYPGVMARTVEEAMKVPCVFMQGAAGDLSPQTVPEDSLPESAPQLAEQALDVDQTSKIKSILKLDDADAKKLQRDMIGSAHRMESFGRRMGAKVIALAGKCETKIPERPSLHGSYERFDFASRVDFQNPAVISMFSFAFFPELAAAAASDVADNRVRPALTTVLLNRDLALVGGSGEFFCSHAVRLKERAYSAKTLFFGYCNGHHMYLPTIEAASQGGYGADAEVSWVEFGAGEKMMNEALIKIFTWQSKLKKSSLGPVD